LRFSLASRNRQAQGNHSEFNNTTDYGARASGTPFISFFSPGEMLALARDAGFRDVRHVSAAMLNDRYFTGRTDGLRMSSGEDFLVATT